MVAQRVFAQLLFELKNLGGEKVRSPGVKPLQTLLTNIFLDVTSSQLSRFRALLNSQLRIRLSHLSSSIRFHIFQHHALLELRNLDTLIILTTPKHLPYCRGLHNCKRALQYSIHSVSTDCPKPDLITTQASTHLTPCLRGDPKPLNPKPLAVNSRP